MQKHICFPRKYANITYLYLTYFQSKSLKGIIQKVFLKRMKSISVERLQSTISLTQILLFTHHVLQLNEFKKVSKALCHTGKSFVSILDYRLYKWLNFAFQNRSNLCNYIPFEQNVALRMFHTNAWGNASGNVCDFLMLK